MFSNTSQGPISSKAPIRESLPGPPFSQSVAYMLKVRRKLYIVRHDLPTGSFAGSLFDSKKKKNTWTYGEISM